MLWKIFLALLALAEHHEIPTENHAEIEPAEFVPSEYGPQTAAEEEITRAAMYGKHYGGDMIFPDGWNTSDAGINDKRFRWPLARVFYVIHPSAEHLRGVINQGIQQYHAYTCLRFTEGYGNGNYILIHAGQGCWSVIGCNGGRQLLSLGQGCQFVGLAVHELGHAVGLFHEHQRSDRDNYITVYKQNVIPDQLHNFERTPAWQEAYLYQYDYNSIMHYGNYAFSRNPRGLKTMEAHNGQALIEPWQKRGFDQLDIYRLKQMYGCQ